MDWPRVAFYLVLAAIWAIPIFLTWGMGRRKNRAGIWWGILLGWIGVLLLALNWPPRRT